MTTSSHVMHIESAIFTELATSGGKILPGYLISGRDENNREKQERLFEFLVKKSPQLKQDLKDLQNATLPQFYDLHSTSEGKFKTITRIVKAGGSATSPTPVTHTPAPAANPHTKKTGGYDVQGAIKGNSVSNGVLIAIARHGCDVTIEQIEHAAREVLELHARLDG